MKPTRIRDEWGPRYFRRSPADVVDSLPLRGEDRELLRSVGLPIGPKKPLRLSMRFEDVELRHQPARLRSVLDAGLRKGKAFPKTGHKELDGWADLTKFVVIGEAPNDYGPGPRFLNRLTCVDGIRGNVWWVYPKPADGKTDCERLNSGLHAYLESLLAYKEFRAEWDQILGKYPNPGEAELTRGDRSLGRTIHRRFLRRLRAADPEAFDDGFWFHHAWDEAILLES